MKTGIIFPKDVIIMDYSNCELCPRRCGVDRTAGESGFCGCPDTALVAKAMLHQWEEPALAGGGGSGRWWVAAVGAVATAGGWWV